MDYTKTWTEMKLPENRDVISDIKNSLPSVIWDHIQLIDDWNEVDEIVCENLSSISVSRNFKGIILSKNGTLKSHYIGSALYFQDHTGNPVWKLNRLTLSQNPD